MPIIKFISRRLGLGVVTLFAVSLLIFLVTQAFPSDPAQAILGRETTPESLDALRQELGLYRPAVTQFSDWLIGILHGDFGKSFVTQMQISEYIAPRVGNSLFLMVVGALLSVPPAAERPPCWIFCASSRSKVWHDLIDNFIDSGCDPRVCNGHGIDFIFLNFDFSCATSDHSDWRRCGTVVRSIWSCIANTHTRVSSNSVCLANNESVNGWNSWEWLRRDGTT